MKRGEELALAIHELLRRIRFDDVEAVCENGISRSECHVLEIVALRGPLSVNEVSAEMRMNKSTASRVVSSLAGKSLVTTDTAGDDARRLSVSVTAKGRSLWRSIVRSSAQCYGEVLDGCTESEREAVLRVLKRLANAGSCE